MEKALDRLCAFLVLFSIGATWGLGFNYLARPSAPPRVQSIAISRDVAAATWAQDHGQDNTLVLPSVIP